MSTDAATGSRRGALSEKKILRSLYLTLFLRGRNARGLQKQMVPKSVASKLSKALLVYGIMGMLALAFVGQSVFALSVYLHGMTLAFVGLFAAGSAGEVLFNKEEGEILLHRPIRPATLLWAKITVLVQVSFWLAGAFNLGGMIAGIGASDGGWMFPVAHCLSVTVETLFCIGGVVLVYQLCLRYLGRERLEGLMTTAQVIVAIVVVTGGQLVPQLLRGLSTKVGFGPQSWWLWILPPTWFAGLDDALAGSKSAMAWVLGIVGLIVTGTVVWLAFGELAGEYETGLQLLNESSTKIQKPGTRGRFVARLLKLPPIRWWLRDSVARAGFVLTAVYLFRDRDVKLRIYPGIAPMMVMPLVFLLTGRHDVGASGFGIAFSGAYLGLVPLVGLDLLQYTEHWQASDLFRAAPVRGPGGISNGARRAVLLFMALPALIAFTAICWFARRDVSQLALLLPGLITLPLYALVPAVWGKAIPFSLPSESSKSAKRGLTMLAVMFVSLAIAGVTFFAWTFGWFRWFLLFETVFVGALFCVMQRMLNRTSWPAIE